MTEISRRRRWGQKKDQDWSWQVTRVNLLVKGILFSKFSMSAIYDEREQRSSLIQKEETSIWNLPWKVIFFNNNNTKNICICTSEDTEVFPCTNFIFFSGGVICLIEFILVSLCNYSDNKDSLPLTLSLYHKKINTWEHTDWGLLVFALYITISVEAKWHKSLAQTIWRTKIQENPFWFAENWPGHKTTRQKCGLFLYIHALNQV